jgi:hypothetical protein
LLGHKAQKRVAALRAATLFWALGLIMLIYLLQSSAFKNSLAVCLIENIYEFHVVV